MTIPAEKIEEIRSKASIVEVVSEFVALKRSGRGYTGLCPFHGEKTPSFHIDEEKQLFHCFGCSKGGSIFDFVAQMKHLTFPETVRLLASRYGVTIEETDRRPDAAHNKELQQRRALVETLREAERLFGEILQQWPAGAPGRQYLEKRGILPETAAQFRMGYAPARWDLIEQELLPRLAQAHKGLSIEPRRLQQLLISAGLIKRRSRERFEAAAGAVPAGEAAAVEAAKETGSADSYYDFFRDRLIFPITRSDGVPVAFTGRALRNGEGIPKYLNTPETPLFSKRRTFFGLSQALPQIRKGRHVYLVEGNIDVVSMVQAGFADTIASCGTAVTPEHVLILKRLVSRATVIFDGDTAGRKAAASCFELFLNSGIDVQTVDLADGDDPDSLCRRLGSKAAVEEWIDSARRPLVAAFLDHCLADAGVQGSADQAGAGSSTQIGNAAARFVRTASRVQNPVEREALLRAAAAKLQTSQNSLERLLEQAQGSSAQAGDSSGRSSGQAAQNKTNAAARNYAAGGPPEAPPPRDDYSYQPESSFQFSGNSNYQGRSSGQFGGKYPRKNYPGGYGSRGYKDRGGLNPDDPGEILQSLNLPRSAFQKSDQKERFLRQIVVSVLREPGLARTIRELESFRTGGLLTASIELFLDSVVKRIEAGEFSFDSADPAGGGGALLGLGAGSTAQGTEGLTSKLSAEWSALLSAAGLTPAPYLQEALRQGQVGGAEPEAVFQEIPAVTTRFSLKEQVEDLREREQDQGDEGGKLEIIQQNLLKRRSIERLNPKAAGQKPIGTK